MNQVFSAINTCQSRARIFVVLSAFAGLTAAACSSSPGPSPEPEPLLEGRYSLEAKNGSSPRYTGLWFGKDGRYEGVRARCSSDCLESGTFTYANEEVSLLAADGTTAKMRVRPEDRAPGLSTSSLRPRSDGIPGSGTDAEEGGAADDPCASGVSATSLSPRADDNNSLLTGGVTCLLTGRLMAFALESDDPKDAATAKLVGNLSPSAVASNETGKGCGMGSSCKRYKCWDCSTGDTGGCIIDKSGSCAYLCPGHTESRCTGWFDSNFMRRCGSGDGCGA